jgi:TolA-binding protein
MRNPILFLILLFGVAVPAAAQQQPNIERRVGRLEQEMRAVQRRVFPGGAAATIDPELQPETRPVQQPGAGAAGDALSTLTSRIDALEAQLARVTGQVEENGFRLQQLEEQVRQLRSDAQERLGRLEQAATAREPELAEPAEDPALPEPDPQIGTGSDPAPEARPIDPAQAAYNAGFRLWEQRRYGEAATALLAVAQRHPRSRWASWAKNLAGRAHLDDNKPAQAARIFLDNYQTNQSGERAADSLFFLGEALVKLNRRSEACPVYDELEAKFPNMRPFLRERLPAARRAARCS